MKPKGAIVPPPPPPSDWILSSTEVEVGDLWERVKSDGGFTHRLVLRVWTHKGKEKVHYLVKEGLCDGVSSVTLLETFEKHAGKKIARRQPVPVVDLRSAMRNDITTSL